MFFIIKMSDRKQCIEKITILKDIGKFKLIIKRGKESENNIPEGIVSEIQDSKVNKKKLKDNNLFSHQMFKDSIKTKHNYRR